MHKHTSRQPINTTSVTVIIVNWNCSAVISKCLEHLISQTRQPDRILIMDNGSEDDLLASISRYTMIEVHLLAANLGFAGANNRALALCNTDYIALLNPDAFPNPDWLENLVSAADRYPEIAAFASLQLCDDDSGCIDGAGDIYHVSGLVWRDLYGAPVSHSHLTNKRIFSSCAAAAMYRQQALVDAGGFDEDFFCYVEDVDLGFRLRLVGHQAMLVNDAVVRHVGSVSTGGQHSDFAVYHGHRNLVWTYIKDMPGILFWAFLPLHLILNLVTVIYFGTRGQGKVILRAKWDAVIGIPKMWRKRRVIQQKRVASIIDIWNVLDKRLLLFKPK